MKKVLLGTLISFSLGLVVISLLELSFSLLETAKLKVIKHVTLKTSIANSMYIKDKVIIKKQTSETNYLNSWKLNITVLGKPSYVMLSRGKENRLLQLKQELEGYKLSKIENYKVLFSKKNNEIWLYMKSKKLIKNKNVRSVVKGVDIITMRKAIVDRYLRKPERLAKTINVIPEIKDGVFQGFNITWIMEGTLLYNYGIRKGDLIQKINGKKIVSLSDAIYSYQKLLESKKFSIAVVRNNKIKEIKYEIVK